MYQLPSSSIQGIHNITPSSLSNLKNVARKRATMGFFTTTHTPNGYTYTAGSSRASSVVGTAAGPAGNEEDSRLGHMRNSSTTSVAPAPPLDDLNTASLEALQDDGQRKILDVVDNLKRIGLSNVLSLPQLVVCGDQSSGKSSVLEAITEIPFPRKENLCTRFATEIILRRSDTLKVTTTINPHHERTEGEQAALRRFSRTISDFRQLPSLIEQATILMGLEKGRAFSRDVLIIEISGPNRPQLTLVDLPGLIHAKNKSQTEEDIITIRELVDEYIKNERTVILAVISAKNDYANQIILEYCRKVDPKGTRTLGIITKPDMLRPGSDNEKAWLDLACNKDIKLDLGWHIVKNREDGDMASSFEHRNASERTFFFKEPYRKLPHEMLGIGALRLRLSRLLRDHLKKEIPGLQQELSEVLTITYEDLEKLGESRATFQEQITYLTKTAMSVQALTEAAIQGRYDNAFFSIEDSEISPENNTARLRANVQYYNGEFSRNMQRYGRKTMIVEDQRLDPGEFEVEPRVEKELVAWAQTVDQNTDNDVRQHEPSLPKKVSRDQAIDHAIQVMKLSRGRELPGSFNPQVIGQLFREQSEPWRLIALLHLDAIATTCSVFVDMVLDRCTAPDLKKRLWASKVERSLKDAALSAKMELQRILDDKDRHPITYSYTYAANVQRNRNIRIQQRIKEGFKDDYVTPAADMDRAAAEEAFDSERAYYRDEMKYFINVVTKQVIERHLMITLPTQIISPMDIALMTEEEIEFLAGEPQDIRERRKFLEDRRALLENGLETFRFALAR
ncbi:hypothetical protein TWF102_006036 [Orbilia oligospora]|uniref:GED domain-containing protein n=2 Tax=Orbilia oligospora TaxID=2813651 RepID=A0A6G1ME48_ORBOL|nr:hypothetical protein TWF102_006036 [Orbilia oligospora]KAF3098607.1 hypothetical protein TWF103_009042 [Orbilia oligospora]KAF3115132.1 hypothetical protein TWF706_007246 [Orbilia oligospora]KAF3189535.1 hypothetical protein TWF788_010612 [Orbilia oligospora]KAF3209414.1 hypothetical protein TWF106_010989 [Orbilia oligospora]